MSSGGLYYDPETGEFRPKESKLRPCFHSSKDLYVASCFDCDTMCNCDLQGDYPDVLVRSLDFKTVRLSSTFVRGSKKLRNMVNDRKTEEAELNMQRAIKEEMELLAKDGLNDSGFYEIYLDCEDVTDPSSKHKFINNLSPSKKPRIEIITIDDDDDDIDMDEVGVKEDTIKDNDVSMITIYDSDDDGSSKDGTGTDLLDLIEFPVNIMDLRIDEEPTIGVTFETLMLVEKYMSMHLEQMDANMDAEKRAKSFFTTCMFPRPPPPEISPYKFEEWEEEFFNVDFATLFQISQAKNELLILDLHYAVEKWQYLFRGMPTTEEFDFGHCLSKVPEENAKTRCNDFSSGIPRNVRHRSQHMAPPRRKIFKKHAWRMY